MSEVSDRILALIQKERLSYRELEKETGINYATLQRYATGGTEKMPLSAIDKIAKALHVEPAYLMGWNEESKEDDAYRKRKIISDMVADASPEALDKIIGIAKIVLEK